MLLRLLVRARQYQGERTSLPAGREIDRARKELAVAWDQFNQAAPAYVDAAIHRLVAAEQAYGAIVAECKAPLTYTTKG